MWRTVKISDVCEFQSGLWKGKKGPFTNANVIRNTNFRTNGNLSYENIAVLEVETKELSKRQLQHGDIILEKSGGGEKTPVGRVVLVDKDLPYPTINSNFTNICRPNTNIVYPRFVVYSFWSKYKNGQTLRNIKQTTGIQNLDLSGFMSEIFILPEIEEQIKISNY